MMDIEVIAQGFMAARAANEPYKVPSAGGDALDLHQANAIQRAFNALRCAEETMAGYKAAANAAALQTALGLEQPITGVLYAGGERPAGSTIQRSGYRTLLIETELGFRAAKRIHTRINSIPELRFSTTTCAPVIELADPGFGRVAPPAHRLTGTDLVAANAASAGFICGQRQAVTRCDVNAVQVRLQRDGTTLHEAQSRDLMGDQWQALLWLVNTVVELGYVIEPGHLLMTGALGPAHPAAPGAYIAEFSGLGSVAFEVA